MSDETATAWHPDRSWVDPLIALLALLAVLATLYTLQVRGRGALRPAGRASLQGRLLEVALSGPRLLTGREPDASAWTKAERELREPWDQALLCVLKAERTAEHALPPPVVPEGPGGAGFRQTWLAAYADGPLPDSATRAEVHRRLGGGLAADLLEARLLDHEGGGERLRAQARQALLIRLAGLGALGAGALGLAAAGLILGLYLLLNRQQTPLRPLPTWSMSGRAATVVLLAWFLAFFLSGNVAALLVHPWPGLRWLALPLGYLLHAAFGLSLLCKAEGIPFGTLWARVAPPGRAVRDLAWGVGFLALAVLLVALVALASNALLKPDQSPQRDLQDLLRGLSGLGPSLALFLTVAGLAPIFEELLFRGFLLPFLSQRRRMGLALVVSALLFGVIHLQPAGLPVLCTLGMVMGLAMRHTGSLRTPILVHACWNGSLFLLMRAFA